MPQFETTHFISQIFWLLLSFGVLYLGVYFIVFPLFNVIFKKRQERIDGVLANAEKLTQETQRLEEEIEHQKQNFEKKLIDRFAVVQQQQIHEFHKKMAQTEQSLLIRFQKKLQSAEYEEKKVLAHSSDFVLKAMKGK